MKVFAFLILACIAVSCSTVSLTGTSTPLVYKAVYLVRDPGMLSNDDLKAHPEVLVVHTTEDFQNAAQSKIALWIDKNAIDLYPKHSKPTPGGKPQRYNPFVLIGVSNVDYAFPNLIPVPWPFEGPPPPGWPPEYQATLDPNSEGQGFSVYILITDTQKEKRAWGHGFDRTPTVQDILDVTDPLLEGVIPATPDQ